MRLLSSAALQSLAAQETGEVWVILLTLSHEDLATPIRVCSDAVAVTSRGDEYLPYPFELHLPDDREDREPRPELRIDNVAREIIATLRTITTPPTVTIELVLASAPDAVEVGPLPLSLWSARYDAASITGELGYEAQDDAPYPAARYVPSVYPGLF